MHQLLQRLLWTPTGSDHVTKHVISLHHRVFINTFALRACIIRLTTWLIELADSRFRLDDAFLINMHKLNGTKLHVRHCHPTY